MGPGRNGMPGRESNEGAAASSVMGSMLTVQPHALDDHVPALCGPLQAGDPHSPSLLDQL